jgi:RNA polymerase sigma factor (sigma-70 family)
MTDQEFIDRIHTGGSVMNKTVEWFYHEHFNLVYQMIGARKLLKEEAMDAYSDAVTAFIENIRVNKFRGDSKCTTYFIRIFNNKCIDIIRKNTTNRTDRNTISLENVRTELIQRDVDEDQNIGFSDFFVQLSEICKEVLMDWSDGYAMEDIAVRNGLRNAHTARSKRYNCFKQLMAILQRNNIVDANINMKRNGEQF